MKHDPSAFYTFFKSVFGAKFTQNDNHASDQVLKYLEFIQHQHATKNEVNMLDFRQYEPWQLLNSCFSKFKYIKLGLQVEKELLQKLDFLYDYISYRC